MDPCIAGNHSWLLVILPRHKNNIVENIWILQLHVRYEDFFAVYRVGLMTLSECCIDRLFPYHMTRCWVRTSIGNGSPI
jgi:hypothetical protein